MSLVIVDNPVPLRADADGVVRIGNTRVTIDTIVAAFKEGATVEEIMYQYPSLRLADVYAVISYYLEHQKEVDEYLEQRQQLADQIYQQNVVRFNQQGIRQRLLARQSE